jgi:hypothetical protein
MQRWHYKASEKCRERVVQKEGLPSRLRPAEKYYFDDSQAAPLKELSNRQCQIEIVLKLEFWWWKT